MSSQSQSLPQCPTGLQLTAVHVSSQCHSSLPFTEASCRFSQSHLATNVSISSTHIPCTVRLQPMLYITAASRLPCMLLHSSSLACACHGCVLYETALSMPLFLLVSYPSAPRYSKVVTCSPLLCAGLVSFWQETLACACGGRALDQAQRSCNAAVIARTREAASRVVVAHQIWLDAPLSADVIPVRPQILLHSDLQAASLVVHWKVELHYSLAKGLGAHQHCPERSTESQQVSASGAHQRCPGQCPSTHVG